MDTRNAQLLKCPLGGHCDCTKMRVNQPPARHPLHGARAPTGPIAQRLEQQTHNLLVPGSNPGGPTKKRFDLERGRSPSPTFRISAAISRLHPPC